MKCKNCGHNIRLDRVNDWIHCNGGSIWCNTWRKGEMTRAEPAGNKVKNDQG